MACIPLYEPKTNYEIDRIEVMIDKSNHFISKAQVRSLIRGNLKVSSDMVLLNWCREIVKASMMAKRTVNDALDFVFLKNYKSFNAALKFFPLSLTIMVNNFDYWYLRLSNTIFYLFAEFFKC
jgi:hypothetical protein